MEGNYTIHSYPYVTYMYIFPDYGMTIVLPVAGDKLDKHVD